MENLLFMRTKGFYLPGLCLMGPNIHKELINNQRVTRGVEFGVKDDK